MIGRLASIRTGMINLNSPHNTKKRAAQKAIVIVAIEKKRVKRPNISFVGKDLRKSSSA